METQQQPRGGLDRVQQFAKDLRREEPRAASEKLAGYEMAARCLDKCRATLVGMQGDFMYGCPMDQMFFTETQLSVGEFKEFVATGASDQEVEAWLQNRRSR